MTPRVLDVPNIKSDMIGCSLVLESGYHTRFLSQLIFGEIELTDNEYDLLKLVHLGFVGETGASEFVLAIQCHMSSS